MQRLRGKITLDMFKGQKSQCVCCVISNDRGWIELGEEKVRPYELMLRSGCRDGGQGRCQNWKNQMGNSSIQTNIQSHGDRDQLGSEQTSSKKKTFRHKYPVCNLH